MKRSQILGPVVWAVVIWGNAALAGELTNLGENVSARVPDAWVQSAAIRHITVLAGRAVAAAGAGTEGIECPQGGRVSTLCRDDGDGTLMNTQVKGCRLADADGRVLSISGDLVITAPIPGGCETGILSECTHVAVRAVHYVATVSDADGTVLDTISVPNATTVMEPLIVPCGAQASR